MSPIAWKKFLAMLAAAAASQTAVAVPSPFVSRFAPLQIENHTNSTLLRDTESPDVVWVLPPSAGTTKFTNFAPSGNLAFCRGLSDLAKASNNIDIKIANIASKHEALEPELKAAESKLNAAREALGQLAKAEGVAKIMELSDKIEALADRRQTIAESIESCTQACEEMRDEFRRLGEEIRDQKQQLATLEAEHREESRAYRRAENAVQMAQENFEGVGARFSRLQDELAKLGRMVFDLYSNKAKLEGGYAQINYDTGWDDAVRSLEAKYPEYNFEKIPTYNVKVFANLVAAADQASYYQSLPMILDYNINGMRYLPWAERNTEMTALPSVMTGSIRLSTIGACPIHMKDFFAGTGFEVSRDNTGSPSFAINATYEYPVSYKYKVTASYNLYKFYEQIKRQGSKGGFFSSRSYSEVIENKEDKDMFKIDWQIEDPASSITQEQRDQISRDLKADLMNRVLVQIAQPGIDVAKSSQFISAGTPPQPGAVVFARGLRSTCGFNIYCQGASWILSGLAAIFGSSETEEKFRQTWNRTASEQWSSDVAKLRAAAIGFKQ